VGGLIPRKGGDPFAYYETMQRKKGEKEKKKKKAEVLELCNPFRFERKKGIEKTKKKRKGREKRD